MLRDVVWELLLQNFFLTFYSDLLDGDIKRVTGDGKQFGMFSDSFDIICGNLLAVSDALLDKICWIF